VLHHGPHRFWFRNSVAVTLVNHHLDFHAIFDLVVFLRVGNRHAAIKC
jgi:hypothetical protein